MLFGLDDIRMRRAFIEEEDSNDERKRREHQRLGALLGYCESAGCRRQVLLGYFGEQSEPCGNCDVCLDPAELTDGTNDARLALEAIHRTGERYGVVHIVDLLTGAENEKILASGQNRQRIFGSGAHLKQPQWRTLIASSSPVPICIHDISGYGGLKAARQGALGPRRDILSSSTAPTSQGARCARHAPRQFAPRWTSGRCTAECAETAALLARQGARRPAYVVFCRSHAGRDGAPAAEDVERVRGDQRRRRLQTQGLRTPVRGHDRQIPEQQRTGSSPEQNSLAPGVEAGCEFRWYRTRAAFARLRRHRNETGYAS
jgi:ATP-dependent DNA helicase RecQ